MPTYDEDNDINEEPAMVKIRGVIEPSWKDIPIMGDMELAEIYQVLQDEGTELPEWANLLAGFKSKFGTGWEKEWDELKVDGAGPDLTKETDGKWLKKL